MVFQGRERDSHNVTIPCAEEIAAAAAQRAFIPLTPTVSWLKPNSGFRDDGGCYGSQRFGALCVHCKIVLRGAYGVSEADAQSRLVAAQLGYAPWYRVSVLLPVLQRLLDAPHLVNLVDVTRGPQILPIKDLAVGASFDRASGGRPSSDARKLTSSEAEVEAKRVRAAADEAAGLAEPVEPAQSAKHCSLCGATGHNKRTCPSQSSSS